MLVWPQLNLVSTPGIYCKGILYWCGCENKKRMMMKTNIQMMKRMMMTIHGNPVNQPLIVSFDIISVPHDEHGRGDRFCLYNGALGLWNESIALCSRSGANPHTGLYALRVLDEFCASWTKFLTLAEGISINCSHH